MIDTATLRALYTEHNQRLPYVMQGQGASELGQQLFAVRGEGDWTVCDEIPRSTAELIAGWCSAMPALMGELERLQSKLTAVELVIETAWEECTVCKGTGFVWVSDDYQSCPSCQVFWESLKLIRSED